MCVMHLLKIGMGPDCITNGESCGMCARGATESVGFFLMFDVRPCELSTVTVIFTFGL